MRKLRFALVVLAVGVLWGTSDGLAQVLGRSPTPQETQQLSQGFQPLFQAARDEGIRCAIMWRILPDRPSPMTTLWLAGTSLPPECAFMLGVNLEAMARFPIEIQTAILAHELGHVLNRDGTPERRQLHPIERERQADASAVRLLKRLGGTPACLALVRSFRLLQADSNHPAPIDRIKAATTGCYK